MLGNLMVIMVRARVCGGCGADVGGGAGVQGVGLGGVRRGQVCDDGTHH
jgi:hypothetical protein